jgi:hypothetical protein
MNTSEVDLRRAIIREILKVSLLSQGSSGSGQSESASGPEGEVRFKDGKFSAVKSGNTIVRVNGEDKKLKTYDVYHEDKKIGTISPTAGNKQTSIEGQSKIASGRGEVVRWRAAIHGEKAAYYDKSEQAFKHFVKYAKPMNRDLDSELDMVDYGSAA